MISRVCQLKGAVPKPRSSPKPIDFIAKVLKYMKGGRAEPAPSLALSLFPSIIVRHPGVKKIVMEDVRGYRG